MHALEVQILNDASIEEQTANSVGICCVAVTMIKLVKRELESTFPIWAVQIELANQYQQILGKAGSLQSSLALSSRMPYFSTKNS